MIEEPRSRVPVKKALDRGGVYPNEVLNSVHPGDCIGEQSKHTVDINKDPSIPDKVKHGSPDRRSKLPSSATKNNATTQKSENDLRSSYPLSSKANSTNEDPSAKSIISGLSAPTNEKKPNSGNYKLLKIKKKFRELNHRIISQKFANKN